MNLPDRRDFLRSLSAAVALPATFGFDHALQKRAPIAFSTLGCPNWD